MTVQSERQQLLPAGSLAEFRSALSRQANVVFALIFKDFRNRASDGRLGLLWVVFDPVSKIIILTLLWYLARRSEIAGVHIALFIAIAVLPYAIVTRGIVGISSAMASNSAFYSYPQVKPIDALTSRFVLDMALTMIGAFLIFFVLDWFFALAPNYYNLGSYLLLLLLSMLLCFGFALFNGTYRILNETYGKVISFSNRPLLFISGLFYSLNDLPAEARRFLAWNPIVHIVEYSRYYMLGVRPFPEADLGYAIGFTLCTLFLAFIMYYANRFKLLMR